MTKKALFLFVVLTVSTTAAFSWRIENGILILEKGDNLSKVAHSLYGREFDYMRLWNNRLDTVTTDPNLVYDGMKFKLEPFERIITKIDTVEIQPIINNYYSKDDPVKFNIWTPVGFLLGFLSSVYGAIIFGRWNRFKEIVREVGVKRLFYEGYPTDSHDLQIPLELAQEFWRFVEVKEWSLRANGHFEAALQLKKLQIFAYLNAVHIEKMIGLKNSGQKIDTYLYGFQLEYNRIYNQDFVAFEKRLKPSIKSILTPFPHPITPNSDSSPAHDYYSKL